MNDVLVDTKNEEPKEGSSQIMNVHGYVRLNDEDDSCLTLSLITIPVPILFLVNPDVKERVFSEIGDDKPKILTADITMISGCDDHQTSADVSNVS